MSPSEDAGDRKVSRRRFLKWAGAFAVVGAAGVELGSAARWLLGQDLPKKTASDTATATKVETDAETLAAIRTEAETERISAAPTANPSSLTTVVGSPPAANSFSIFWITDTQFLSETNPAMFKTMNNWIVKNWLAYNGKLVIHTGDMVEDGNVQQEWVNANDAMSIFLQNGIPYTWCAGNHDDLVEGDETSGWNGNQWGAPAFDPVAVSGYVNGNRYPTGNDTYPYLVSTASSAQWVGDFHDGMDTALSFTANGLNFLVINIEWNADPTVLQWAEGILDDPAYTGYNTIIAPHAYIDAYGEDDDARWGPTLAAFVDELTELLDAHPNVFLTLNGHFATDSGYNTPVPINGRNELMFDRQDCCDYPNDPTGRGVDVSDDSTCDTDKVGGATVTILNFDTDNNQINVSTYDVYTDQWRIDAANQYTVTMFADPPPQNIASVAVSQAT